MHNSVLESQTTYTQDSTSTKPLFVYVIQLHSGQYVIGQASNAARKIALINSGLSTHVQGSLQVNRIIAVKEVTPDRTLPIVVANFCKRFGNDRVTVA
jgi:hypothetical protein